MLGVFTDMREGCSKERCVLEMDSEFIPWGLQGRILSSHLYVRGMISGPGELAGRSVCLSPASCSGLDKMISRKWGKSKQAPVTQGPGILSELGT